MRVWVILVVFLYTIFCSESGIASSLRSQGNNTIIALLPIHTSTADSKQCSNEVHFKSAVESQALEYAVQKVNSDPNFKDQISLGLDIEDMCNKTPQNVINVIDTSFTKYKNQKPSAFIVDLSDLLTRLVLHESKNVPVFTLGSHRPRDDAFIFEPSKPRIGNAVETLLRQLNWTAFDVLVANASDYEYFKDATKTSEVCENRVFYEQSISGQTLNNDNETYPLLIFSDTIKTLTNLPAKLKGRNAIIASNFLEIDERFPKTFALKQRVPNLDEFEEFLRKSAQNNDSWFGGMIRKSAQFGECKEPGNESCLSEILGKLSGELRHGGKVIDAVYTIAHALKNTKKRPLSNDDIVGTPEFTSPTGKEICFSAKKELSKLQYNVYNLAKTPATLLGNIQTLPDNTKAQLSLVELDLNRDTTGCLVTCPIGLSPVPTSAKCCVTCEKENSTACEKGLRLSDDGLKCVEVRLDYLKWKHPLSIVIFILVLFLFCVLFCLVNLYHKKAQSPTILTSKLATMPLLLSLFITLIHPMLPIIKPSATSCNAYVFGFVQALGIPLCILISRSNSYFKKFREEDGSLKRKVLRSSPQNLIAIFLIVFQIILSIIFIAVLSAHVVHYETADPYVDYIECSTFSGGEFLFPFFFIIILSLFFSVKNFGAETVSEDTYEAHFTAIFFLGFYLLSFINIVVVYAVTGKVKVMLLCVLGVLYLLNFLFFIFLPKVYVIVLNRDLIRFSPPLYSDREVLIFGDLPGIEDDQPEHKEGPP
jgi:hypothetical protein